MNVFFTTSMMILLCFQSVFAQVRNLVINEFMFDPTPAVGLPEAEYVELMNVSGEAIPLSGWTLNERPIPVIHMMPGQLMVLCEQDVTDMFDRSVLTVGMESWDRLNNEGQTLVLKDRTGQLVDSLAYDTRWITDPQKKGGGWSLERINPLKRCSDKYNWSVSVNLHGGTPGFVNSVYSLLPDMVPPILRSAECPDVRSVRLNFSEPVDFRSVHPDDFFKILPERQIIRLQYKGFSDTQVLYLAPAIDPGKVYHLSIKNILDCEQNTMPDTLVPIGMGVEPVFNDLLITELMVDEIPSAGLPESEYIEVLNRSAKMISLRNTYIFADSTRYNLPDAVLFPGLYYLFVPASSANLFESLKGVIPLDKFPRLLNDGRRLTLYDDRSGWLFSVRYDKTWYKNAHKSEGGYSIEMIDTQNPCGDLQNWEASRALLGGTPGKINSVIEVNPDNVGPEISSAYAFEKNKITIQLSEKLHPGSFRGLMMRIDGKTINERWTFDTLALDRIELPHTLAATGNVPYTLEIFGARDCVGNLMGNKNNSVPIYIPKEPEPADIIINEILFNPKPGGVDWIEIYNMSGRHLDLINCYLSKDSVRNGTSLFPITMDHFIHEPASYLVLTTDIKRLLRDFPLAKPERILEIPDLPPMPDLEGLVNLWTEKHEKLDEVNYEESQHSPLIWHADGVSLERITPFLASGIRENWHSASSKSGYGTPTFKNSQFRELGGEGPGLRLYPKVFSPDHDGYDDLLHIQIISPKPGYVSNMYVFNLQGKSVKILVKGFLLGSSDVFTWDGIQDNGSTARPGHYILLVELVHPDGELAVLKEKFVLALRL